MESQLYSLLNNLLNPKKLPAAMSLAVLISLPAILEFFFIVYYLHYNTKIILTIESISVLFGYASLFLHIKARVAKALEGYREKRIFRLIGSFAAVLYLLSPGIISLILGLILLCPCISSYAGRKIIEKSHIDPSVIQTLLELNNNK